MELNKDDVKIDVKENLFDEQFVKVETIGNGSFGKVVKCIEKSSGEKVAVKIIDISKYSVKYIEKLKSEIHILEHLNHPNIIEFRKCIETHDYLYFVMNFIKNGTLANFMQQRFKAGILNNKKLGENFTEEEASIIIKSIVSAIEYMHDNSIVHRDLKPENILVANSNDLSSIKIIDFGLSIVNTKHLIDEYCGTIKYMAPEQIDQKNYGNSIDLWTCGIMMYMLLNQGEHPFINKGEGKKELYDRLKKQKYEFKFPISE